ncbi:hypothetical protein L798_06490 [Zootermopsis nevadensis]|uniref:Uncharacterized protein n=1 Tax=Zootermopsis nevadensis TaxID=136037 RepID=A0A067R839_ZOONE|nr:hypothetical protein L798_06490 [Zootermopsis nevadensis]
MKRLAQGENGGPHQIIRRTDDKQKKNPLAITRNFKVLMTTMSPLFHRFMLRMRLENRTPHLNVTYQDTHTCWDHYSLSCTFYQTSSGCEVQNSIACNNSTNSLPGLIWGQHMAILAVPTNTINLLSSDNWVWRKCDYKFRYTKQHSNLLASL